ncbi:MAG: hypothetical protein FWH26_05350 [Oscillospiraceae bacterium]|nr:hypothetical protein [Oscillospiraceae bacterium]
MAREQDGDMKIFVSSVSSQGDDLPQGDDLDALAALTEEQRSNGNLTQAKRLGRELAAMSSSSPELAALAESFRIPLNPERERHLQVLTVFCGQTVLSDVLRPSLLADAAITSMNNYLINHTKEFWDSISDGRAFTQYLLVLRSQATREEQAGLIGEVFARVCGQEDNPDLRALGASVFITAGDYILAKWVSREG